MEYVYLGDTIPLRARDVRHILQHNTSMEDYLKIKLRLIYVRIGAFLQPLIENVYIFWSQWGFLEGHMLVLTV